MSTTTTISKGKMFRCTVAIDDDMLKKMRNSPELAAQAIQAGADYWHTKILPQHFENYSHAKYGYANRALATTKDRRKAGKPDLVMTGSLRDGVKARASFSLTGGKHPVISLRMSARVLNFVPNMSDTDDSYYVKRRGGKSYPNIKREIRMVRDDEREAVAKVVQAELARLFNT